MKPSESGKKRHPQVLLAMRDPTPADDIGECTIWVSVEYVPNRVFSGNSGTWVFVGKFYPEKGKEFSTS